MPFDQPFGGVVGRTLEESTPWWPTARPGPAGRAQRRDGPARRRRLRPVRLLRLRHRHADVRPARRRRPALLATSTRPRCARRPGPACSPAATTTPTAWPASSSWPSGFPGYDATIPHENGFLSEILARRRVRHLRGRQVAPDAGARTWPWARRATGGRSAGASSASTGSSAARPTSTTPTSSTTTTRSTRRRTPEEGYHLTEDLADQAIALHQGPAGVVAANGRSSSGSRPAPATRRTRRRPTFIEPLPRPLRPGLGRVARRGLRPPGRVRAAARRARSCQRAPVVGAGVGRRSATTSARSTPG